MKRLRSTALFTALLSSMAVAFAAPARADGSDAPNHAGFAFGTPTGEALLALGIGLTNASSALPQRDTGWGPDAPRPYNRAFDRISDVTGAYGGAALALVSGYAVDFAYFRDSGSRNAGVYALHGTLVDAESAFLARGVVDALKRLTGRCRPRYFIDGACTNKVRDAFPSGHTAPMAAIAGARLLLALQTTGNTDYRFASFGVAETMAVATAFLRVGAGMHSVTDVAAGFLLGHGLGLLVALAHPMQRVSLTDYPPPTSQSGFALTWSGSF